MIVQWEGGQIVADREAVATLYRVSKRTVRRYCTPLRYEDDKVTGRAWYDAVAVGDDLADVVGRPERAAAAIRARIAAARMSGGQVL